MLTAADRSNRSREHSHAAADLVSAAAPRQRWLDLDGKPAYARVMTDQQNTEFPFAKGDLVRKGNGSTVYRITHVSAALGGTAGVCKASTAKDPARTCMYPFSHFTAVTA